MTTTSTTENYIVNMMNSVRREASAAWNAGQMADAYDLEICLGALSRDLGMGWTTSEWFA